MRPSLLLAACCAVQAFALPAHSAPNLGATLEELKAQYSGAELSGAAQRSPVLSFRDVDYDGVRWTNVRFTFGPSRHLHSLTMTTQSVSYEDLVARVRMEGELPRLLTAASQTSPTAYQIRICDDGEGRVTLTYEPETTPT